SSSDGVGLPRSQRRVLIGRTQKTPEMSRRSQPSAGGPGSRPRSTVITRRALSQMSTNTFASISALPAPSVNGTDALPSSPTVPVPVVAAPTTTSTAEPGGPFLTKPVCAAAVQTPRIPVNAATIRSSRNGFVILAPSEIRLCSRKSQRPTLVNLFARDYVFSRRGERLWLRPPHHRQGTLVFRGRRTHPLARDRAERNRVRAGQRRPDSRSAVQGLGPPLHARLAAPERRAHGRVAPRPAGVARPVEDLGRTRRLFRHRRQRQPPTRAARAGARRGGLRERLLAARHAGGGRAR